LGEPPGSHQFLRALQTCERRQSSRVCKPSADYESGGQEFESLLARHKFLYLLNKSWIGICAMQNNNLHGVRLASRRFEAGAADAPLPIERYFDATFYDKALAGFK
jgi:hypothetical protein